MNAEGNVLIPYTVRNIEVTAGLSRSRENMIRNIILCKDNTNLNSPSLRSIFLISHCLKLPITLKKNTIIKMECCSLKRTALDSSNVLKAKSLRFHANNFSLL